MAPNLTAIAKGACLLAAWRRCLPTHSKHTPQRPQRRRVLPSSLCLFIPPPALLIPPPADFGFDDAQRDRMLGGWIAAAFYLVGAPAALLFGWLSDRVNRKRLLFAAVVLGEGPCMLTIFVTNYWQLFVLRLLTGIALGGAHGCSGACVLRRPVRLPRASADALPVP